MFVDIQMVEGPVGCEARLYPPEAGAVLAFEDIVRPVQDGRRLSALCYVTYEPLAMRELTRLARELMDRHTLVGFRVRHSVGTVEAGHTSLWLEIACRNRREALDAVEEFIERLKSEVPIWRVPVWNDSASEESEPAGAASTESTIEEREAASVECS